MNLVMRLYLTAHRLHASGGPLGRVCAKPVQWICKALTASDIDPRCEIHRTVLIPHATGVVVGETAVIGPRTVIMPGVVVGARSWDQSDRHAKIGADVIVGAGAKILGPIRVGDGARIGANAVVLHDVAPGSCVVGIPARPVPSGKGDDAY